MKGNVNQKPTGASSQAEKHRRIVALAMESKKNASINRNEQYVLPAAGMYYEQLLCH